MIGLLIVQDDTGRLRAGWGVALGDLEAAALLALAAVPGAWKVGAWTLDSFTLEELPEQIRALTGTEG